MKSQQQQRTETIEDLQKKLERANNTIAELREFIDKDTEIIDNYELRISDLERQNNDWKEFKAAMGGMETLPITKLCK
jgi:SMC interacting uncharacterized protein involved in chromosome segregation